MWGREDYRRYCTSYCLCICELCSNVNQAIAKPQQLYYSCRPLKSNSEDGKSLSCHTEKEKHGKQNDKTAGMLTVIEFALYNAHQVIFVYYTGILAGMWPCGIIVLVNELFLSESLSQVYGILHGLLRREKIELST